MEDRLSVHEISDAPENLVVVLQYPGLETGPARLVAPLLTDGALKPIPVVTVPVTLHGKSFLLAAHQMTAFPVEFIGNRVGSLLDHDYEIQRALSRLFFGN